MSGDLSYRSIRCGECDPSFGCFDGSRACQKWPANSAKPPLQECPDKFGQVSIRPRVVTELIGVRVAALIPELGPLGDETLEKIGRIVTVAIGDRCTIVVQIEDDDGWVYTTNASAYPLRRLAP